MINWSKVEMTIKDTKLPKTCMLKTEQGRQRERKKPAIKLLRQNHGLPNASKENLSDLQRRLLQNTLKPLIGFSTNV